jgi:putative transposase
VKLVIMLKLAPASEQHAAFLETMERFNEAANWIAGVAFERKTASKCKLQELIYHDVRERFGLSAQMTVRCISKVAEAYKRDKKKQPIFKPRGALIYDERIMSFKGLNRVSLLTLKRREIVPIRVGDYQRAWLARKRGQADLLYRNGAFYLALSVDAPEPVPDVPVGTLGVDLGMVNLATDSDGKSHSGEAVEKSRARYERIRRKLQKAGTKSAKRHLKRISGGEKRFKRDTNHRISKVIVGKAKNTGRAFALEDLRHLKERTTVRRSQRSRHGRWAYGQLCSFIEYKARLAGVEVYFVDPRNTSRACSKCGYCERANRKNRAEFVCRSCGYAATADVNAAMNIAARAAASQPIVAVNVDNPTHSLAAS